MRSAAGDLCAGIHHSSVAFFVRRRRKLVVGFLTAALCFAVVRYVALRSPVNDDEADDGADVQDSDAAVGSSASKRAASAVVVGAATDGDIPADPVHQLIRSLLVPPNVGFGVGAGEEVSHKKHGRKRRRRGRRRGGRGRGGGGGRSASAGGSTAKKDYSQHGQSRYVDERLGGRRDGFYVESGASDGETGSNSLFFELDRNWSGVLVEANPRSFRTLVGKRRRAWALNACLSPTGRTTNVRFRPAGGIGGIVDHMPPGHRKLVDRYGFDDVNVTCFALADVVAALPVSPPVARIDYWSLDVEGAELAILGAVDWTKTVPIDVVSVEYKVKDADGSTDVRATADKLDALRKLFGATRIYRELGTIKGVDVVFRRTADDASGGSTRDEKPAGGGESSAVASTDKKSTAVEDDGNDGGGKDGNEEEAGDETAVKAETDQEKDADEGDDGKDDDGDKNAADSGADEGGDGEENDDGEADNKDEE